LIKVQGDASKLSDKLNIPISRVGSIIMDKMEELMKLKDFKGMEKKVQENLELLNSEMNDLKIGIVEISTHKAHGFGGIKRLICRSKKFK
jgi:hypothetical protein